MKILKYDGPRNLYAKISDQDIEFAEVANREHPWRFKRSGKSVYLVRQAGPGKTQTFAQLLFPGARMIKHLDGNGLNYQRENLEPCY